MSRLVFAFFLFIISAAYVNAQEQTDPLNVKLAEARALITEGNAKAAVAKLQSLPDAQAAKDIRVAQLLGVAYYHAGEIPRAIETLIAILDKLPPDSADRRETVQ